MEILMRIIVTGGAGFIGSCFVRLALQNRSLEIANVDKLTYAGNLENLTSVAENPRYRFFKTDICDLEGLRRVFDEVKPEAVVHFAAESHVDRSIFAPQPVFETNLRGTFNLLETMRAQRVARFIHVSTDEVYGSLEAPLEADEQFPLQPSSPYSAGKAGSDLLALSYHKTYKLPVIVTRASNNYGPYQFPEKLIPLMITHAFDNKPLPVYGDGMQIRDWLYVEDHCRAILTLLRERPRRRDLQHRRQSISSEQDRRGTDSCDHRQAIQPDRVRDGPAGARSPLRAFEREVDAARPAGSRKWTSSAA